jgi:uncharacterized protein with GYD domain
MAVLFPIARSIRDRRCTITDQRSMSMATYVTLASFTEQGIRNVKESPDRLGAFKAMVEKLGITLKSVHYTTGAYDMVTVVEGSDEAITAALLKLGTLGNIRTQSMRAFSPDEMKAIIAKMP